LFLSWDSTYDLKYECVISASIILLYVLVRAYVGFRYLMLMLWLYVGLRVCGVFFSCCFLPSTCPGVQIFVTIGVYSGLCIRILIFWCSRIFLCGECVVYANGCVGPMLLMLIPACMLCHDIYNGAVC
jgi:hypothetical protein